MNERYDKIVETISLVISLMNLQENLTQGDKQDLLETFNQKADILLKEIHSHLEKQDKKMDLIIKLLQERGEPNAISSKEIL